MRVLAPRPSVEVTPASFGSPSPNLLEEEGNARRDARITELSDPLDVERPMFYSTLPSCDDPMNSLKVKGNRAKQRLAGKEAHFSGKTAQMVNAIRRGLAFDGCSKPNVSGYARSIEEVSIALYEPKHAGRPLRQYLKHMLIGRQHDLENGADYVVGNIDVKQVTHAINEDTPR